MPGGLPACFATVYSRPDVERPISRHRRPARRGDRHALTVDRIKRADRVTKRKVALWERLETFVAAAQVIDALGCRQVMALAPEMVRDVVQANVNRLFGRSRKAIGIQPVGAARAATAGIDEQVTGENFFVLAIGPMDEPAPRDGRLVRAHH